MRIAVDVDITIVRSDLYWLDWLQETGISSIDYPKFILIAGLLNGRYKGAPVEAPYDLSALFTMPPYIKGLDWWKGRDLYASMMPDFFVKEILDDWSLRHDIVFVSKIKGDHAKSKYQWLKYHFPYLKGVLYTCEKHLVDCDVMIDDRLDVLEKFDRDVITVHRDLQYEQSSEFVANVTFRDWNELRGKFF